MGQFGRNVKLMSPLQLVPNVQSDVTMHSEHQDSSSGLSVIFSETLINLQGGAKLGHGLNMVVR